MPWTVYVLLSTQNARTYVGITTDLERRLQQHNGSIPGGAKRTRADRPWEVGTRFGPYESQSEALKVELKIKRLRGRRRLAWKEE